MVRDVYIQPGEIFFGSGAVRLRTLLGSCVSVVLWHDGKRCGGMCHFMLPSRSGSRISGFDGRYADEAIAILRREVVASGTRPGEYRTAIYGGGNMFPDGPAPHFDVGGRNVYAAKSLLGQHGFLVEKEDVGGRGYRRLTLDLRTGQVHCVQAASGSSD